MKSEWLRRYGKRAKSIRVDGSEEDEVYVSQIRDNEQIDEKEHNKRASEHNKLQ